MRSSKLFDYGDLVSTLYWRDYSYQSYAFLNLLSWLGLIGYLRYIKTMRQFWQLVVNCIIDMFSFMIFMIIFSIAFATTYFFVDHAFWEDGMKDFLGILII